MITKKEVQDEIAVLIQKDLNWNTIKQLNELYRLLGYFYASDKMKEEFTGTEVYTIEEGTPDPIFTKSQGLKWVYNMQNEDGSEGQHWTMDQTTAVMHEHSYDLDPVEFYIVMNMLFSDFGRTLQGLGIPPSNADAYARLSKSWLCDSDAVPDKLHQYKLHIVK